MLGDSSNFGIIGTTCNRSMHGWWRPSSIRPSTCWLGLGVTLSPACTSAFKYDMEITQRAHLVRNHWFWPWFDPQIAAGWRCMSSKPNDLSKSNELDKTRRFMEKCSDLQEVCQTRGGVLFSHTNDAPGIFVYIHIYL